MTAEQHELTRAQTSVHILWLNERGVEEEHVNAVKQGCSGEATVVTTLEEFQTQWKTGEYNVVFVHQESPLRTHVSQAWQGKNNPLAFRIIPDDPTKPSGVIKPESLFSDEPTNYQQLGATLRVAVDTPVGEIADWKPILKISPPGPSPATA